jgi:hypothetical protein
MEIKIILFIASFILFFSLIPTSYDIHNKNTTLIVSDTSSILDLDSIYNKKIDLCKKLIKKNKYAIKKIVIDESNIIDTAQFKYYK